MSIERPESNLGGRIGLGFVIALNMLLGLATHGHADSLFEPDPSAPPRVQCVSFFDLLDKIGEIVGRGFCWLEAKLGLTPKK